MVHFTMFGGQEGRLSQGRGVYINIFGGASLKRQPFASHLIEARHRAMRAPSSWQYFFFNLFGGMTIKWPTIAEEYFAILDAVRSGTLNLEEWDRQAIRMNELSAFHAATFSLFGGVDLDAIPGEDEELEGLALQRHLGHIPDRVAERLMVGVGQHGAARLAVVRQAVAAALTHAA